MADFVYGIIFFSFGLYVGLICVFTSVLRRYIVNISGNFLFLTFTVDKKCNICTESVVEMSFESQESLSSIEGTKDN